MGRMVPHTLLALGLAAFTSLGLGYRALWQDEVETAERARTILESGYLRVIDAAGRISLNNGGWEIEEGTVHRDSPWGQYYLAAIGLAGARMSRASIDVGVRLPSTLAHGATSGLISYGMTAYCGVPAPWSLLIGLAVGLQSNRLVYNRTARYHSLLDFLIVLGMFSLAASRAGRSWAPAVLGSSVFALPQTHAIGGCTAALILLVMAAFHFRAFPDASRPAARARLFLASSVVPAAGSLAGLALLTRPWRHAYMWEGGSLWVGARALLDWPCILYAFVFAGLSWCWSLRRRDRVLLCGLGSLLAAIVAGVALTIWHPYAANRYYWHVALAALLWPLALGFGGTSGPQRRWIVVGLILFALSPDMGLGMTARWGAFRPFQGVRLVLSDLGHALQGDKQPLHEAVEYIRNQSGPEDPVLFDYVPQYGNWYLPGHPIALLPDASAMTALNRANVVWSRPRPWPLWHVWYPGKGSGPWNCSPVCDLTASDIDWNHGTYVLTSKTSATSVEMCVVREWATHHWNNSPLLNLTPAGLRPAGVQDGGMVLARPCLRSRQLPWCGGSPFRSEFLDEK